MPMIKLGMAKQAERRKMRFHRAVSLCFRSESSCELFWVDVGRNDS